jgi:type I restriction enzyme S subunit
MNDVAEVPFDQLLIKVIDNRGKTCPVVDEGMPLIATNCIKNDKLFPVFEKVRYVNEETMLKWFRGHPKPGDIVFVTKGTPGRVAWVPNPVNFCIAQDMVALQIDETKVVPKYLFAALRSNTIQGEIENLHVGSLIPHFKKGDFGRLLIPVPNSDTQKYIGEMYFTISYKIDLLHRNNKTLEDMAETLIKESCKSCKTILLGDIIEIYDNKRIPLSSIQRAQKKEGKLYPYYGAATIMDYVNDFIFDGDYILLGEDGTVQTEDGYPVLQRLQGKAWVNNHTHVISAKAPFNNDTLEMILKNTSVSHIVTGAVQPKINQGSLKNLELSVPENNIEDLCLSISTLMSKRENNNKQIGFLSTTRDTLLPKLMSGQVRVKTH